MTADGRDIRSRCLPSLYSIELASMSDRELTCVVVAPDGLPSAQLTTVGLNGLTARRGLADLNLAAEETLVVTGAVGGVAVELAAARALTVIAVPAIATKPSSSEPAPPSRLRPAILARSSAR
jgi:NADPH-dependent curcumin reductase CurA